MIISAIRDKGKIVMALRAGAKGFIEKPLKLTNPRFVQELGDEIHEVLALKGA